ncbi:MAG: hypothetical protein HY763_03525 [Planctomycetes bacterium]|nr:hypothetical protein [Planctomycetota bacterium]
MSIESLLCEWPSTVPELIDRAFCNLARMVSPNGEPRFGTQLERKRGGMKKPCFSRDDREERYVISALMSSGYIDTDGKHSTEWSIQITPEGWARFDALTRTEANRDNPVFVAMWFGDKKQTDKMNKLFDEAISPACQATGWKAKRADKDPHNNPIAGHIMQSIRVAPFVIADLTENNNGVYYETGFATGCGRTVIFCCPEDDAKNVHFDVRDINQVRYKNSAELQHKLEDHILRTMGRGPHDSKP